MNTPLETTEEGTPKPAKTKKSQKSFTFNTPEELALVEETISMIQEDKGMTSSNALTHACQLYQMRENKGTTARYTQEFSEHLEAMQTLFLKQSEEVDKAETKAHTHYTQTIDKLQKEVDSLKAELVAKEKLASENLASYNLTLSNMEKLQADYNALQQDVANRDSMQTLITQLSEVGMKQTAKSKSTKNTTKTDTIVSLDNS